MFEMTGVRLSPYLDWLSRADEDAITDSVGKVAVEVEALLEAMLWGLMSEFLSGPMAPVTASLRTSDCAVQYVNFPFYSHYKSIRSPNQPWIGRYPFFFGNADPSIIQDVLRRYAFLHFALTAESKPIDFSLTGFSGNESWGLRTPPQYVTITTRDHADLEPPKAISYGTHRAHFNLAATLPPVVSLRSALKSVDMSEFEAMFSPGFRSCAVMGDRSNSEQCSRFWSAFERLRESSVAEDAAKRMLMEYGDQVSQSLASQIACLPTLLLHEDTPENRSKVGEGLARFIAWNHALGFRNIIYCPYRTLEPSKEQNGTKMISWGGAVIVLGDRVDLVKVMQGLESTNSTCPDQERLSDFVANIRIFVDLATPKVIVGDWKYYQQMKTRQQIGEEQALAVAAGLNHELLNLGEAILLNVPKGVKRQNLATRLRISARIAELVWVAYLNPKEEVSLSQLMDQLREILCWEDIVLDDGDSSSLSPNVQVQQPMVFAMAELCRNAYKHGSWQSTPPDGEAASQVPAKKTVTIAFLTQEEQLLRVTISNPTEKPDSTFDGRNPKRTGIQLKGRLLVQKVVEDLLGGRFSFAISKGHAEAVINLF